MADILDNDLHSVWEKKKHTNTPQIKYVLIQLETSSFWTKICGVSIDLPPFSSGNKLLDIRVRREEMEKRLIRILGMLGKIDE